jgi:predicted nucleic acid-binding protein
MSFLLDTNIASAHLRLPRGLSHRFVQHSGGLLISAPSVAELYVWANRASDPEPRLSAIEQLLRYEVALLPFDLPSARTFGTLKRRLQQRGTAVHDIDLLIASAALAHDLTLVTHNTKHFSSVPALRLEDWLAG